ncbi:MAG: MFS transporter [Steroidobacteraceae bacterium]
MRAIPVSAPSVDPHAATIRKIYLRLIPLLFLMMFFNYLDRINLGFAGLQMNHALGFSPAVFGFGASIFFLGYMILQIPSNLALYQFGARIWLAACLIGWGLVASVNAFIQNEWSFYTVRFLLGLTEAGLLPGMALYVTFWFPSHYRARAIGGYIIAGAFAAILGGPLQGWQWMFLGEGLSSVLLGLFTLYYLPATLGQAKWLSTDERSWLESDLATERAAVEQGRKYTRLDAFRDIRVWLLSILFGCALVGIYGLLIWLPLIIKSLGNLSYIQIGFLSAVPPLLGVIGTIVVSTTSDLTGDRKMHLATVYLIGAIGMLGSALVKSPVAAYLFLCLAGLGMNSGNSLFWSLNASFMTGIAAAVSIAAVNMIAQFGGLVGPWMIGAIKGWTDSFSIALIVVAGFLFIAALIAASMRVTPTVHADGITPSKT